MTVAPGSRLGPYEITAKLGEGGMGEVYRATDTRLDRQVAIKVLPAAFTADAERLARFEREAKLLAQLHHPHIASIFGLEESSGVRALVMELVEGEELSAILARGPLPIAEALAIARQIAEALEAAHERGIVHRDLKPQNVKVQADGTVKVLDFGLAKAMDASSGVASQADLARSPTLMNSPTLTAIHGTQLGVILGTAAYMAPEQARGGAVDKRADIWSFGVVLYEMLTGRQLFAGDTVSDVLAAVLTRDPTWSALPPGTPPAVLRVLRRCLERNPKQRLHDIADARLDLSGTVEESPASAPIPRRSRSASFAWGLAIASCLTAAVLAILFARGGRPSGTGAEPLVRLQFVPAKGERITTGGIDVLPLHAISPDGTKLVYAVEEGASTELHLRALDAAESTVIPGTEGGKAPTFSPDGKWIAFAAQGKLKKVAIAGGTPLTLANAPVFRGAVWSDDGTIFFVPNLYVPIARIPDGGGTPQPVTKIRTAEGELQHRWPDVLPGGKVLLYAIGYGGDWDEATIVAERVDTGERKVLVKGGTSPRFLRDGNGGQLIYARAKSLYAINFDPESLEVSGAPVEVARNVTLVPSGFAEMAASRNGILVTAPADANSQANVLSWVDREGRGERLNLPPQGFAFVSLSPQGDRAALGVGNGISILDLGRLSMTKLTLPRRAETPIWAADGRRVFFGYEQGKAYVVHVKAADDSGTPQLAVPSDFQEDPFAVTSDGMHVLVVRQPTTGDTALVIHDLGRSGAERVLLTSPTLNGINAGFSPDDRFVVYESQESGRPEIYVRPASGEDRKWQVSIDGGTFPVWSPAGDEIFFLHGPQFLAASVVERAGELAIGEPRVLFANHVIAAFAVTRDGKRFLVAEDPNPGAQGRLDVVLHWADDVRRKLREAGAR
jgi:serine/threonine-protein kinase